MGARLARRLGLAGAALALLAGCASGPRGGDGVTHVVRRGETIYRIARHYGVSSDAVMRANRISDASKLAIGYRLFIPGVRGSQPARALRPPPGVAASPKADAALARRDSDLSFVWPVDGRISSGFGWRRGRRHEGIDIPARRGTVVRAAEAGRVIHSGNGLGAYGNVVIVKHAGRYSTVYAHNRKNLVHKGEFVEKGQVIAQVGTSGNASGPHLHFEIRRDRRAQNPRDFLP